MRRRLIFAAALAAAALLVGVPAGLTHPGHGPGEVDIANYSYNPNNITVYVGDSMLWLWTGSGGDTQHTVTSDDGQVVSFDSDAGRTGTQVSHQQNDGYTYRFDRVGTYTYHCKIHPGFMKGTVTVEPVPAGATGPATALTPLLSNLRAKHRRFCSSRSRHCKKAGTVLMFDLSDPSTINGEVRRRHGSRASGPVLRSFAFKGTVGPNTYRYRGSALPAGDYRMKLVATTAAGYKSEPARLDFSVNR